MKWGLTSIISDIHPTTIIFNQSFEYIKWGRSEYIDTPSGVQQDHDCFG
jgi:hypothetical protein